LPGLIQVADAHGWAVEVKDGEARHPPPHPLGVGKLGIELARVRTLRGRLEDRTVAHAGGVADIGVGA